MGGWLGLEVWCRMGVGWSEVGSLGEVGEWWGGDSTRGINFVIHASIHSFSTYTGN